MKPYLRLAVLCGCITLIAVGGISSRTTWAQTRTPVPTLITPHVPITANTIDRLELLFTTTIAVISPSPFALSPDGKTLAAIWNRDVSLYQIAAIGEPRRTFESSPIMVTALAFSPDGSLIAGGGYIPVNNSPQGALAIWDVASGALRVTFKIQDTPKLSDIQSIAFSPDGSLVAAGGFDGLRLWRVAKDGQLQAGPQVKDPIMDVRRAAFSSDGSLLAVGAGDGVRILSFNASRKLPAFQGKPRSGRGIAFSPDGSRLAFVGDSPATPKNADLSVWELSSGKETLLAYPIDGNYTPAGGAVSFSPDGSLVAATNASQTAQVWDVKTGKVVATLHATTPEKNNAPVLAITFSPDGTLLIGTAFEGIWIWGVKD